MAELLGVFFPLRMLFLSSSSNDIILSWGFFSVSDTFLSELSVKKIAKNSSCDIHKIIEC